jgi:hypothetical protein
MKINGYTVLDRILQAITPPNQRKVSPDCALVYKLARRRGLPKQYHKVDSFMKMQGLLPGQHVLGLDNGNDQIGRGPSFELLEVASEPNTDKESNDQLRRGCSRKIIGNYYSSGHGRAIVISFSRFKDFVGFVLINDFQRSDLTHGYR